MILALSAAWPTELARAQTPAGAYGAEAVQAGFVFNFIRFTEWPAGSLSDNSPFVVGVAGSRMLEDELIALADRQTARDRRIRVVRVKSGRDVEGCHVLYISQTVAVGEEPAPAAEELLPHTRGRPILTVSSGAGFIQKGGIINLYREETGKLRFEISPKTAKESGLVLSSRLLALAKIVDPPEEKTAP